MEKDHHPVHYRKQERTTRKLELKHCQRFCNEVVPQTLAYKTIFNPKKNVRTVARMIRWFLNLSQYD